jgi:hypothetical protein
MLALTRADAPEQKYLLAQVRPALETSFSQLWYQFLDRVFSRSWPGFWNTVQGNVIPYHLCPAGVLSVSSNQYGSEVQKSEGSARAKGLLFAKGEETIGGRPRKQTARRECCHCPERLGRGVIQVSQSPPGGSASGEGAGLAIGSAWCWARARSVL